MIVPSAIATSPWVSYRCVFRIREHSTRQIVTINRLLSYRHVAAFQLALLADFGTLIMIDRISSTRLGAIGASRTHIFFAHGAEGAMPLR